MSWYHIVCNTYYDWTEGCELIIQHARLVDVTGLEGHLQTGLAHAEAHGVHVDVVGEGGTHGRLVSAQRRPVLCVRALCVLIFKHCIEQYHKIIYHHQ